MPVLCNNPSLFRDLLKNRVRNRAIFSTSHLGQSEVILSKFKLILFFLFLITCNSNYAENKKAENLTKNLQKSDFNETVDGKIVRSIEIFIKDVFEGKDLHFIYKAANSLKINTKARIIKQELLFDVGDELTTFKIDESSRLLRSLRYIRHIDINPKIDGNFADVIITAQDTWTIIPQVSLSSGDGKNKTAYGLQDSNFLGRGKRFEVLRRTEKNRTSTQAVYDDRRLLGTPIQLLTGYFDRNDGEKYLLNLGKPFRSLYDKSAYGLNLNLGDTIGRLFRNGDERFIFRQDIKDISLTYSIAHGEASKERRRYTFGWNYQSFDFSNAVDRDFSDLSLDRDEVLEQDSQVLATNRRFSGPIFSYQEIKPDYLSLNYIDRFDFVEDFNLGRQINFNFQFAPKIFGSKEDAFLFSGTINKGWRQGNNGFFRAETAISSRLQKDELVNTLVRAELKYFKLLGPIYFRKLFFGNHTLASSFFIDFGNNLDDDRELLIGADNALRAYEARTFTGDKRFALGIEDRIHLFENVFQLINIGSAIFFEVGGSTFDDYEKLITNDAYADIGIGLRASFPRSSGSRILRFDVSFPLRDGPDGSAQFEPRFLVSAGQLFSAFMRSELLGAERASVDIGFDR